MFLALKRPTNITENIYCDNTEGERILKVDEGGAVRYFISRHFLTC